MTRQAKTRKLHDGVRQICKLYDASGKIRKLHDASGKKNWNCNIYVCKFIHEVYVCLSLTVMKTMTTMTIRFQAKSTALVTRHRGVTWSLASMGRGHAATNRPGPAQGEPLVIRRPGRAQGEPLVIHRPGRAQGEPLVIHRPGRAQGEPLVIHRPGPAQGEPVVIRHPGRAPAAGMFYLM